MDSFEAKIANDAWEYGYDCYMRGDIDREAFARNNKISPNILAGWNAACRETGEENAWELIPITIPIHKEGAD
jgi:hypothetical protein